MANWNKMAEAFGRAVHNRERLVDHAPLTKKGYQKAFKKDQLEDERFRRSATNAGAEEEFRRGFDDEEMLPGGSSSLIQTNRGDFVEPKDFTAANREQAEFDKVFDDAINDAVGRHQIGDMPEAERKRKEAELRRNAIEMLKDDRYDISDVLDILRQY